MNSRAPAFADLCLVGLGCSDLDAESHQSPPLLMAGTISSDRDAEPVTLTFFNRPIVTLRARILGRRPADRVAGAHQILEDLSHSGVTGPVLTEAVDGGVFITVGSVGVMGLSAVDVDELAGETLPVVTARTVANLQQALNEAHEARATRMLVRASIAGLLAIALAGAVLWAVGRARRVVAAKFIELAERRVTGAGIAPLEALRASRVLDAQRHIVTASIALVDLIVIYSALTFTLRQFPYTRPWGESMSGFLLTTVENLGLSVVNAVPGLF